MKSIKSFITILLIAIAASACKTTSVNRDLVGTWNFFGPDNIAINWQILENGKVIATANPHGKVVKDTVNWEITNTNPPIFRILDGDKLIQEMTIISNNGDVMEMEFMPDMIIKFTRGPTPITTNIQDNSQFHGTWRFDTDEFYLCYHLMKDGQVTAFGEIDGKKVQQNAQWSISNTEPKVFRITAHGKIVEEMTIISINANTMIMKKTSGNQIKLIREHIEL